MSRFDPRAAILMLLLVACGNVADQPKKQDTAADKSTASRKSTGSVLLLRLDPKTSIPYENRDRTDQSYFHGFRILAKATPTDADTLNTLSELLMNDANSKWSPDLVRDGDYGVRFTTANGASDLLICMHCATTVVARPLDATEAKLSAENALALRGIFASVFPVE